MITIDNAVPLHVVLGEGEDYPAGALVSTQPCECCAATLVQLHVVGPPTIADARDFTLSLELDDAWRLVEQLAEAWSRAHEQAR